MTDEKEGWIEIFVSRLPENCPGGIPLDFGKKYIISLGSLVMASLVSRSIFLPGTEEKGKSEHRAHDPWGIQILPTRGRDRPKILNLIFCHIPGRSLDLIRNKTPIPSRKRSFFFKGEMLEMNSIANLVEKHPGLL